MIKTSILIFLHLIFEWNKTQIFHEFDREISQLCVITCSTVRKQEQICACRLQMELSGSLCSNCSWWSWRCGFSACRRLSSASSRKAACCCASTSACRARSASIPSCPAKRRASSASPFKTANDCGRQYKTYSQNTNHTTGQQIIWYIY